MIPPAQLCPELQELLAAELVAGNRVVDCGPSPHAPAGVLVLLDGPFRARSAHRIAEAKVDYVEINDPHWWQAEYVHRPTGHVLAARFSAAVPGRAPQVVP